MFYLSNQPLDTSGLRDRVLDPACGAIASFEGLVRNHHLGRTVERLHYEAHAALAQKEGSLVVAEALKRFDIAHAVAVHRVGALVIGEAAIVIHVGSAHRAAAFEACQFLIDEIKHRVPIWKREFYADGTVAWVAQCEGCSSAQHA